MIAPFSPKTEKSASGRPPVARQNLRASPPAGLPKEKSRLLAAPRRSTDGAG